jgi:hypothetical protein
MNLEAGAKEFRTLFEDIDFSLEDFEFSAYTRIKQLKLLLQTGKLDDSLYWRAI